MNLKLRIMLNSKKRDIRMMTKKLALLILGIIGLAATEVVFLMGIVPGPNF